MASSAERSRRAFLGSVSMLGARGFGFATSFLAIGIVSRSLSREEFGLWSVFSSFAFFGASFDFGLGQAMRNRLTALRARPGNDADERHLFFAVLYALITFSMVVLLALVLAAPFIPWTEWLAAGNAPFAESVPLLATLVAGFYLISMPLNLNIAAFLAYQEANRRSAFDVLQSALVLAAAIVFAGRTSFGSFLFSYYFVYDVAAAVALVFFIRSRAWSWPGLVCTKILRQVRPILGSSLRFWLLGVAAMLLLSSDPLIAARVLGLAEAGDFNVVQKLFAVLLTVHFTVLTPLWSAYAHAAENGDWAWIDHTLKRSLAITGLLIGVGAAALLGLSGPILRAWVDRDVSHPSLAVALAVWAAVYAVTNCYSVVLNGLGNIGRQTVLAVGAALLNWPLSLWMGRRFGAQGIVEATIIVLLPTLVSNHLQVHRILKARLRPTVESRVQPVSPRPCTPPAP